MRASPQTVRDRTGDMVGTSPRVPRYDVGLPRAKMPNYLPAIRRSATWLALCIAAGAAVGYVGVNLRTPLYRARTLIELRPLNAAFLGLNDLRTESVGASGPRHADIDTQVELLRAPDLRSRAAAEVRARFPNAGDAVELAIRNLEVRPVGRGRLVEIVSQSSSAEISVGFSNAVAAQYGTSRRSDRVSEAERIRRTLHLRAEQLGVQLEREELELARFARTHSVEDDLAQAALELNHQIVNAQVERADAQARQDTGFTDAGAAVRSRQRLSDLRHERVSLLASLTPRHPAVVRLDAQIESTTAEVAAANVHAESLLEAAVAASAARGQLLISQRENRRELVFNSAHARLRFDQLRRAADVTSAQLSEVMRRVEQADLLVSVAEGEMGVVQWAQAADRPTDSSPSSAAGAGALLAALAGFAIVLVRARSDTRIRSPRDLEQAATEASSLGSRSAGFNELSQLGTVPWFKPTPLPRAGRLDSIHLSGRIKSPNSPVTTPLNSIDLAEGRRPSWSSLAASLALVDPPQRVVAVTGLGRFDGSTTVAIGIAAALSALGWRALVVDANSQAPAIHERMGVPLSPGLGELLHAGPGAAADSTPVHAIAESPGLYVLAAGDHPDGLPAAMGRFSDFLTQCRSTFDFVIIDTPVLASGADARIAAKFGDAVTLVVRSDHTTRSDVASALDRLGQDGIRRTFSVLNGYGRPPVSRTLWNLS